jgi:hypothetical protein
MPAMMQLADLSQATLTVSRGAIEQSAPVDVARMARFSVRSDSLEPLASPPI